MPGGVRLGEIAQRYALTLRGDATRRIKGVCTLAEGRADALAFHIGPADTTLQSTRAGAVIVTPEAADACPAAALVAADPKLAYARIASLFEAPAPAPGVHPTAVIDAQARVDEHAVIAAHVVVAAGAEIQSHARLDAGCVIGAGAVVGPGSVIGANACIGAGTQIGRNVRIGPAAVLGDRGFGLVQDGKSWLAVPQLGRVAIGDDVEIGAGCTIDRGTIADTVIGEGVKLDARVHIAHNCVIGAHTVIAGCTGIAGSAQIGAGCVIGGSVGIGDHVRIADGVVLTGGSQVPADIDTPGVYSSTLRVLPAARWRRVLAVLRKLDELPARLRKLKRYKEQA